MQTLVLCDDYWHPAQTVRAGLDPLHKHGFRFDWIEQGTDWLSEQMNQYATVILTKTNHVSASNQQPWVNNEVQAAFVDYVERGGSLLVVHSGASGYDNMPLIRELIGGMFVQHPPQCPVTVEPNPKHQLTTGVSSFTLVDEHYFMALDDKGADVFLTTRSSHGTQPAGWTRTAGAGRICVITPGHNLHVWLHPSYQALLANALDWCHRNNEMTQPTPAAQLR